MAGKGKHKLRRKPEMPAFTVQIESDGAENGEDRLLSVYEFLLEELETKGDGVDAEN